MFPQHLLPQLSPNGAKLYLILLSLLEPRRPRPLVIAPMLRLMQLSELSARACSRALHELRDLQLIRRLRRRYHAPNVYLILPHPSPAPAHSPQDATIPSQSPTEATLSPTATSPTPPLIRQNPAPSPEIPHSPPQATLLNALDPATLASAGDSNKPLRPSQTPASPGASLPSRSKHTYSPPKAALLNALASATLASTGELPHSGAGMHASQPMADLLAQLEQQALLHARIDSIRRQIRQRRQAGQAVS